MLCGGTTEARDATADDQRIADQIRDAAEEKAGQKFPNYVVHKVKTQTVAGTNYFFKVKIDEGKFVHLRVHQTLPHAGSKLELSNLQLEKSAEDALEYF